MNHLRARGVNAQQWGENEKGQKWQNIYPLLFLPSSWPGHTIALTLYSLLLFHIALSCLFTPYSVWTYTYLYKPQQCSKFGRALTILLLLFEHTALRNYMNVNSSVRSKECSQRIHTRTAKAVVKRERMRGESELICERVELKENNQSKSAHEHRLTRSLRLH